MARAREEHSKRHSHDFINGIGGDIFSMASRVVLLLLQVWTESLFWNKCWIESHEPNRWTPTMLVRSCVQWQMETETLGCSCWHCTTPLCFPRTPWLPPQEERVRSQAGRWQIAKKGKRRVPNIYPNQSWLWHLSAAPSPSSQMPYVAPYWHYCSSLNTAYASQPAMINGERYEVVPSIHNC